MTHGRAFNVFVAEDDEEDVAFLKEVLSSHCPEINFVWFKNGDELTLRLFRASESPSLIMLDLNMPKKDGRQVLKEIRSRPDFDHVPILVVTTSDFEHDRLLAKHFSSVFYMRKPFGLDEYETFADSLSFLLKKTAAERRESLLSP